MSMDQHIYMTYDDRSPESVRDADETHAQLLRMGYHVIAHECGYTSTRYEYAR